MKRAALLLLLAACTAASPQPDVSCADPGTLQPGRVANEAGFDHRFVIYLPPCYAHEAGRLYPVVYLFPGRSGGPSNWFDAGLAEVVDDLILSAEIPPIILVGLDNTDSDMQGLNFYERVLPFVEANYRVLTHRQYRAVAGASQGGAPAYRLALQHPDVFGSAALFGSGAISGEEERIAEWLAALPAYRQPRFFLNTGFQDPLMLERAEVLAGQATDAGLEVQTVFEQGDHSYTYWVSSFPAYLRWLAQGW
jgi:enterochelin esterase-like enzyme